MSQQINLLDPSLRPRREWLSLMSLVIAVGVALLMNSGLYVVERLEFAEQSGRLATVQAQTKQLQDELVAVGKMLAEKKSDPNLVRETERASELLRQREEVLRVLQMAGPTAAPGFSGYFMAFSRQAMEGVWLTGFSIGPEKMEIRGRMLDGALLPVYVRRLDGEPSFHGRRFAALEMKGVTPLAPAKNADRPATKPERPYVEFVLQGASMAVTKADGQ